MTFIFAKLYTEWPLNFLLNDLAELSVLNDF